MIGGIFCQCELGEIYKPRTLESVNRRCYQLVGNGIIEDYRLKALLLETLWKTAYRATSKYISTKSMRDFKNDTIDLMRSMGCAIYYNGNLKTAAQFSANNAVREQITEKQRNRKHPAPFARFSEFVQSMPLWARDGWSVAFVATMPYAVQLEKGYGKRVLIGNINSVVNAFYREFWPEKRKQIWYGYYFETGGFELDTAMATSVNTATSKSPLAPKKR